MVRGVYAEREFDQSVKTNFKLLIGPNFNGAHLILSTYDALFKDKLVPTYF